MGSTPSGDDPEDQSEAGPLSTLELEMSVSQPLPSDMNPFRPYPNENSWHIGDWYWNQGAQKSKQSFKKLVEIITSADFQSEDLYVNKHLCFHIKNASTPIKTSLNGNQLQLVLDHSVNFTQNHETCNCSPVATFVSPVQLPVFLQSFDWTFKHYLYHTNWAMIDRQLGSLGTNLSQGKPMVADSEVWQAEDSGWMRRDITISVPFPQCSLHPGPRNYTMSNFHHWSLLSIIHETLLDPVCCRSFQFELYSLQWQRSCGSDDLSVYGELFSSQAFISAHCDLQDDNPDVTSCALPRHVIALMFWSDATQLTAFGDAKLWRLYVYFGNESKYQRCTPTANLCLHAAYFQTVRVSYIVAIQI